MHGQAGVGPKLTSCHRCRKINLAVSARSAGLVCERIGRDARRPTVTSSLARVEAAASSRFGVCLLLSVVGAGGCCLSVRGAVPLLVAGCGLAIFWRRQCGWWHANGEGVAAESGKWRRKAEAHSRLKTRVCALNFFPAEPAGAVTAPLSSGGRMPSAAKLPCPSALQWNIFCDLNPRRRLGPTLTRHLCLVAPHPKEQK